MTTATKISCMLYGQHERIPGFICTPQDIDAYERILRDRRALLINDKGKEAWFAYDGHCLREVKCDQ